MANIEDSVPVLRGFAAIVPEKPTQLGFALDPRRFGRAGSVREWNDSNRAVFCSQMRTDRVVERQAFPKQVFEVPLPEDDEMLLTLFASGLDEPHGVDFCTLPHHDA